jgi:hypothetical protein
MHTLSAQAFNTAGMFGKTLKDILRDEKISKSFPTFAMIQTPCSRISAWHYKIEEYPDSKLPRNPEG